MSGLLAAWTVRLAAALLPAAAGDWGRAMVAEAAAIADGGAAFRFALGCLRAALAVRLSRQEAGMPSPKLIDRPRRFAALCAVGAVLLGFAYMAAAGAPAAYFVMNGVAVLLGLLTLSVLAEAGRLATVPESVISMALAGLLLLVSVAGVSADGVTRWIAVGGVVLQPSLVLLPVLALSVARAQGVLSLLAVTVAALAFALQPDRAMAGALAAAMAVAALVRRDSNASTALIVSATGFAVTMVRPDPSPAMPFVDQIFFSSFAVHPLAGMAVALGAALLLVPAAVGMARDPVNRLPHAVFGSVWFAIVAAAALGNYPTPLVGYGGSAILGYLISLIGVPPRLKVGTTAPRERNVSPEDRSSALRARLA